MQVSAGEAAGVVREKAPCTTPEVQVPVVTVRFTCTVVVLDAGADDVGVLRAHQTAPVPAASFDVMLGNEFHVPLTDPVPTAVESVQAVADVTGQAVTVTAWARVVELPETTDTLVVAVPASEPEFVRVIGFVIEVTVDENVVVMALVPLREAPVFPIVTLEAVVPVAVQSAHAAEEPPATNAMVRAAARRTRRRRLMR
ncbi:hypothetical protein GCM10017714_00350 [Curtobacterium pusillum]